MRSSSRGRALTAADPSRPTRPGRGRWPRQARQSSSPLAGPSGGPVGLAGRLVRVSFRRDHSHACHKMGTHNNFPNPLKRDRSPVATEPRIGSVPQRGGTVHHPTGSPELVMIRNWALPGFLGVVVQAEEDAIRILNVGDSMAVSRGPDVLLHELPELRIIVQFRNGLAVDPELSRGGRDAEALESLKRLPYTFYPDLEVVQRLSRDVRGPERTPDVPGGALDHFEVRVKSEIGRANV